MLSLSPQMACPMGLTPSQHYCIVRHRSLGANTAGSWWTGDRAEPGAVPAQILKNMKSVQGKTTTFSHVFVKKIMSQVPVRVKGGGGADSEEMIEMKWSR